MDVAKICVAFVLVSICHGCAFSAPPHECMDTASGSSFLGFLGGATLVSVGLYVWREIVVRR